MVLIDVTLQAKPEPEDLQKLVDVLSIGDNLANDLHAQLGSHWWPQRGLGTTPPSDPVIYRLFEVLYHIIYAEQFTEHASGSPCLRPSHQSEYLG